MAGMLPLLDHSQMNWVLGALGESIFRGDSDPNLPTIHRPYWSNPVYARGIRNSNREEDSTSRRDVPLSPR